MSSSTSQTTIAVMKQYIGTHLSFIVINNNYTKTDWLILFHVLKVSLVTLKIYNRLSRCRESGGGGGGGGGGRGGAWQTILLLYAESG